MPPPVEVDEEGPALALAPLPLGRAPENGAGQAPGLQPPRRRSRRLELEMNRDPACFMLVVSPELPSEVARDRNGSALQQRRAVAVCLAAWYLKRVDRDVPCGALAKSVVGGWGENVCSFCFVVEFCTVVGSQCMISKVIGNRS